MLNQPMSSPQRIRMLGCLVAAMRCPLLLDRSSVGPLVVSRELLDPPAARAPPPANPHRPGSTGTSVVGPAPMLELRGNLRPFRSLTLPGTAAAHTGFPSVEVEPAHHGGAAVTLERGDRLVDVRSDEGVGVL